MPVSPCPRFWRTLGERWTVERGLQLCAQSALDIATHLAASTGRDAPDHASAIDVLGEIGGLPVGVGRFSPSLHGT